MRIKSIVSKEEELFCVSAGFEAAKISASFFEKEGFGGGTVFFCCSKALQKG